MQREGKCGVFDVDGVVAFGADELAGTERVNLDEVLCNDERHSVCVIDVDFHLEFPIASDGDCVAGDGSLECGLGAKAAGDHGGWRRTSFVCESLRRVESMNIKLVYFNH